MGAGELTNRHKWLSFLILLWFSPPISAQESDPLPEHYESYAFTTVRIPVWVHDQQGIPNGHLTREDFLLQVDGRPTPIEHFMVTHWQPMEITYLLDLSGSMALGGKLAGSIDTVNWLLSQNGPYDRWRIVVFSDGQILEVADHETPQEWQKVIPKLRGYGKTALFDTLAICDRYFPSDSLNNRAVVAFTDGNDNHSLVSEAQLLSVLQVLRVPLFVVAIGNGFIPQAEEDMQKLGLQTLRNIATITGGSFFLARSSQDLPVLGRKLRDKLGPQYMLTLTVERAEDEEKHEIEVALVKHRAYSLRYRRGYLGKAPYR